MESISDNELHEQAVQVCTMGFVPVALKAAIELDVFNIIARAGPDARLSAVEIVGQLPSKNPGLSAVMLNRVLQVLAGHSILVCVVDGEDRRYGLAPLSKFLVGNEDEGSLAPLVVMCYDKVQMESWYYLKEGILEGKVPFERAFGMSAFEYHGTNPRFNDLFNKGMSSYSTRVMKKILNTNNGPFEGLKELVDVGGGIGANLRLILSKYPQIKGINYDLKHVIDTAPPLPGAKHVSGDLFESVPSGEAIFMKWILHDWNDEECIKILKNCHKALPEGGKVIVLEAIMPGEEDDLTSSDAKNVLRVDVLMLAVNTGKERTQKEYEALAMAAGFSTSKKLFHAYCTWVMEFHK